MTPDDGARCLFCRIVAGAEPARIVRDDEWTLTFADIEPVAPVHVLVVTRAHVPDVAALGEAPQLAAALLGAVTAVVRQLNLSSFRTVFNTGPEGGQHIGHVHAHVLSGRRMGWPPG